MISRKTKANLIAYAIVVLLYFAAMRLQQYSNDTDSADELSLLEPVAQNIFNDFVTAIETETEWNVHINSGKRTPEQQAELKRKDPRNADAFSSKHVLGLAIDLNLYSTYTLQYIRKSDSREKWIATGVPAIAKRFGLKWGGDFKNYHDPVHFEIVY
ncbi:MAG: M15 family metallopeptidase [Ferruginibacter sp.]